jgi:hypothetical protein
MPGNNILNVKSWPINSKMVMEIFWVIADYLRNLMSWEKSNNRIKLNAPK